MCGANLIALAILSLSIVLQLLAAGLSLRLIRLTGLRVAWGFLASALVLMAARRCVTLYAMLADGQPTPPNLPAELVALTISGLILVGIARVRPLFEQSERTDAELRLSETRLENAQRIGRLGNWDWDIVEGTLYWSDEIYRIFGLEHQEFGATYKAFLETIHPDDRKEVEDAVNAALNGGDSAYGIDHRICLPDGTVRVVHEQAEAVFGDDGQPVRMVGTVQDITERVAAEDKIAEREIMLRAIMNNVADGIITIDKDGTIETFSRSAENMFGYPAEEVRGQNIRLLMPDPDRSHHDSYLASYLDTGQAKILGIGPRELTAVRRDGTEFPIDLAIGEMKIGDGRRFIGTVRDVTERKKHEDQLRQAQKMEAVGQLTGGVAHDFNNILTVIVGNIELLTDRVIGDSESEETAKTALGAALRGSDLTRRLLAFSRQQSLAPEVLNVGELILGAAGLLRRTLGEHIEVETALVDDLWNALVDAGQLQDSLLNLAINARDAMPNGGTLRIETANTSLDQEYAAGHEEVVPGPYVMIAVSDTGHGMSPEVVEQVFEPFFTTKEVGKGSGLGLSMVYGFIKQSGGHISVYSEPGIGTTIKLYLPMTASNDVRVSPDLGHRQPMPGGAETILVVEDDPDVRMFVAGTLSSFGYNVLEAEHGPAALEVAESEQDIHMLLTDIVLPRGMNGHDVAREVQKLIPGIKVLYSSGYTENAIADNDALEGVELLMKPYRRAALARKVRDVLDGTLI